jgi:hypothetical protein
MRFMFVHSGGGEVICLAREQGVVVAAPPTKAPNVSVLRIRPENWSIQEDRGVVGDSVSLEFMSVFTEDYRCWRLRLCLQKSLKVAANIAMCRWWWAQWWAHLSSPGAPFLIPGCRRRLRIAVERPSVVGGRFDPPAPLTIERGRCPRQVRRSRASCSKSNERPADGR